MERIRLSLLGRFELRLPDGRLAELETRKTEALVTLLAYRPGEMYPRDRVAATLWGDRSDQQARHSLSQALTSLRRAVPDSNGLIKIGRDAIAIDPGLVDVDVVSFERLALSDDCGNLRQAAVLYRGPLLDGFALRELGFADWLARERMRLAERAGAVLLRLADAQTAAMDQVGAIAVLVRAINLDPLLEEAHRRLIRLYIHQGRYNSALQQYRACEAVLKREIDAVPEPSTVALGQEASRRHVGEVRSLQAAAEHRGAAVTVGERAHPGVLGATVASARGAGAAADGGVPVTAAPRSPGAPGLSIVVLPFLNLSGEPAQEYFADGITENLTTDLSRIPSSFVIARGTAFTYKGKPSDAKQVGRELGVRYVLEGSIQRFGTAFQVNAQLIDTETGAHLWADRFDGDLARLSDLRDAVTTRVTRSLNFELPDRENRRFLREPPGNPDVVNYILRARAILNRTVQTKEDDAEAWQLAAAALRLDPQNSEALITLANADVNQVEDFLSDDRTEQLRRAEEEIDRALAVAPGNYLAHAVKARVLDCRKRTVDAIAELETALGLNPNYVAAYAWIGRAKFLTGHPVDTFNYIEEAIRRSPKDRSIPIWRLWAGNAHLWLGHLDSAIAELRKAAVGLPSYGPVSLSLACAFGLAGREMEARDAFADANRLLPNFTIAKWKENALSDDPTYLAGRERCYEVVRKLGMPEK